MVYKWKWIQVQSICLINHWKSKRAVFSWWVLTWQIYTMDWMKMESVTCMQLPLTLVPREALNIDSYSSMKSSIQTHQSYDLKLVLKVKQVQAQSYITWKRLSCFNLTSDLLVVWQIYTVHQTKTESVICCIWLLLTLYPREALNKVASNSDTKSSKMQTHQSYA